MISRPFNDLDEYIAWVKSQPTIADQMKQFAQEDKERWQQKPWYKKPFSAYPDENNPIWVITRLADAKDQAEPTMDGYLKWRSEHRELSS